MKHDPCDPQLHPSHQPHPFLRRGGEKEKGKEGRRERRGRKEREREREREVGGKRRERGREREKEIPVAINNTRSHENSIVFQTMTQHN